MVMTATRRLTYLIQPLDARSRFAGGTAQHRLWRGRAAHWNLYRLTAAAASSAVVGRQWRCGDRAEALSALRRSTDIFSL